MANSRLQLRIKELEEQHGGLNAAARVLKVDAGYLSRLASGEKDAPGDKLLRKMGLRRVVWFERLAPVDDKREGDDEITPEEWQAMYRAQCYATDAWAKRAEEKSDAAMTARIAELEAALAKVNARLTTVQNDTPEGRMMAAMKQRGAAGLCVSGCKSYKAGGKLCSDDSECAGVRAPSTSTEKTDAK